MLRKYGELFRFPGASAFTAVGAFARLPISMFGLATILLVSTAQGQYSLAGFVSGTALVAGAIGMPQIARQVDRWGQARIVRPVVVIGALAWTCLALAVTHDWPTWTWFLSAAIGGATGPNIGALVRARWMHVLGDRSLQQRAFSWESAIDEVVFMIGPPLATFLATSVTPWAGVAAAAAVLVTGGLSFTALRSTEPPPAPHETRIASRQLINPAFIVVCLVFACAGTVFGSVDLIVVAFAEELGRKPLAGVILGIWAAGSLLAGLTFGVLNFRRSVGAQFVSSAVVFGLAVPLLLLASNLATLAALSLLTGLAIAPLLISGTIVVERLVPGTALTEALTWSSTSLICGVTIGAAAAGRLVDAYGARPTFWLTALAALAAALIAVVSHPLLRGPRLEATANRLATSLSDPPYPVSPVPRWATSRSTVPACTDRAACSPDVRPV